ncbi:bifunctional [glutamate--ammonia ligase]-adenylyl-L-tyrosine phosphorylase/[glutamate--ammonia-ligase] adenylyltransferase [Bythopirellula polymerisocia]|uniref:Glutamate-ammonia-ligase adenylyltransferase n=1 Tax=Bythopirellula polymerisocia TaxID=2528003 RepID=A0A5C6CZR6_9BACT|nr:bifunctional [glutamate--ammonia ligase]-adenylyl-L-tyrosine phosphorylase/[glutamate--ammonia-ligase] adenylyltransferase [Bythopirellula polymerisocia]TWU30373.1 Glutamate-ammonia-ligase adenylyltransferase [Bythopirellula polymerisocia]
MTKVAIDLDQLRRAVNDRDEAGPLLITLGVANLRSAHANLVKLAADIPLELLSILLEQFAEIAPQLADPDMALNNLERFFQTARSPLAMAALFERDRTTLPNLLLILNTSQHLSDQLCGDPESYDLLRMTEGRPVAREVLVDELVGEVRTMDSESEVLSALRRFKRRETLRIAYGDIVLGVPVAQITRQISYVADAAVEAALDFAIRKVGKRKQHGNGREYSPPRIVALALGKLGGLELNYSSDIDLVFLFQAAETGDASQALATAVAQETINLLSETTELGFAYRVDMRLRPEGRQGPLCVSVEQALTYYDMRGRTWERQAYVKARPMAGDLELGYEYLERLEPWVYRRYLSLTDITGIKALKRRIEVRSTNGEFAATDVKAGLGGIRDIEFVIQFLQLLNGGALEEVRTGNTLEAIARLNKAGALTHQESAMLEENYGYLRKLEHRLQIMYDLQTHQLPKSEADLGKIARRMGYTDKVNRSALEAFRNDFKQRTEVDRKILDHLLHDAFSDNAESEPEVDLVNDPDPTPETIAKVMGKYPFADPQAAYSNLMSLAEERIPFLSTRRCRMFLASISPRLLAAIALTPDPDGTLVNLSRVSDSLGSKAALWELFSSNRPTLNLYVTLCAACPYLAGILTSNPGMIDELLDSLLLAKLPDLAALEASLAELTRGAEDKEPILHSFKVSQHLRVGVRDILGKDDIQATHGELSNIAEVCLRQVVEMEYDKLLEKRGEPRIEPPAETGSVGQFAEWQPSPNRFGQRCDFIVLALGKLGGREPNYHSDLDLVFLYEAEGRTVLDIRGSGEATTNNHFFSELAQRIIKRMSEFGPYGRLFEVDARLRPTGRGGALAVSLEEFVRYFLEGAGQLWERQALCKARVVVGSRVAANRTMEAVWAATYCKPWQADDAATIREMRMKLEESASERNLKRGPGGTMDVEFIVQMLQLKHGLNNSAVRETNTLNALVSLEEAGFLAAEEALFLKDAYNLLRSVEARIRLMDATGRHEFPDEDRERSKLAYLMARADPDQLAEEVFETCRRLRETFLRIFAEAEG